MNCLSLLEQDFEGDYEYIMSDELYPERREAVKDYADELGIPLIHVKAPIHNFISVATTFNAGLRVAKGDLIVIVGDYNYMSPNHLREHFETFRRFDGRITLTSGRINHESPLMVENPNAKEHAISTFIKPFNINEFMKQPCGFPSQRSRYVHQWIDPYTGFLDNEWVNGHIGIPRKVALRVNGFDEAFNKGKGYSDHDLAVRCEKVGHRFLYSTSAVVYRCFHPHANPDDLEGVFIDKPTEKTRQDNYNILADKSRRIHVGEMDVDAHDGIEDRRWKLGRSILVAYGGARFVTERFIKVLNNAGIRIHQSLPGVTHNFTDYVVFGVSLGDLQFVSSTRDSGHKFNTWLWWTGSDVWNLVKGTFGLSPDHAVFHDNSVKHIAVGERTQEELKSVGIMSDVLLPVFYGYDDSPGTDLDFDVLLYASDSPAHNNEAVKDIMLALPEVKFNVVGHYKFDLPNVRNLGWVRDGAMSVFVRAAKCYLRYMNHDGMPHTMIQALGAGRPTITNYPYHGAICVNTTSKAVEAITDIMKGKGVYRVNDEIVQYYRNEYNVDKFRRDFIRLFYGVDISGNDLSWVE